MKLPKQENIILKIKNSLVVTAVWSAEVKVSELEQREERIVFPKTGAAIIRCLYWKISTLNPTSCHIQKQTRNRSQSWM